MKQLNFQSLFSAAIAEGATTPNPGVVGVQAWSTTLAKVVAWNGTTWNAPAGGSGSIAKYISNTAPDPAVHTEWYTLDGEFYIWDGEYWFQPITASPPAGVTSVGVSVPTGLSVASSPITSSGTIAISFTAGYSIPATTDQTNWNTAYGWGNHASAGYQAALVSGTTIKTINGNNILGSGDISVAGGSGSPIMSWII